MKGYRPLDSFDTATADIYDRDLRGDEQATVALLAELARGGPALELAIGTGRVALPRAAPTISPRMASSLWKRSSPHISTGFEMISTSTPRSSRLAV